MKQFTTIEALDTGSFSYLSCPTVASPPFDSSRIYR